MFSFFVFKGIRSPMHVRGIAFLPREICRSGESKQLAHFFKLSDNINILKLFVYARSIAKNLRHPFLGIEHVFLAIKTSLHKKIITVLKQKLKGLKKGLFRKLRLRVKIRRKRRKKKRFKRRFLRKLKRYVLKSFTSYCCFMPGQDVDGKLLDNYFLPARSLLQDPLVENGLAVLLYLLCSSAAITLFNLLHYPLIFDPPEFKDFFGKILRILPKILSILKYVLFKEPYYGQLRPGVYRVTKGIINILKYFIAHYQYFLITMCDLLPEFEIRLFVTLYDILKILILILPFMLVSILHFCVTILKTVSLVVHAIRIPKRVLFVFFIGRMRALVKRLILARTKRLILARVRAPIVGPLIARGLAIYFLFIYLQFSGIDFLLYLFEACNALADLETAPSMLNFVPERFRFFAIIRANFIREII